MYQILVSVAIVLLLIGCGTNSSKSKIEIENQSSIILNKNAKKSFGILADATINIYEMGNGEKRLLFSEDTTGGSSIDEIGNFNGHVESLNNQNFYLYELIGGKNWDIDHNGILDSKPTINNSIYRAIYKGRKNHIPWWIDKKSNRTIGLSEKF